MTGAKWRVPILLGVAAIGLGGLLTSRPLTGLFVCARTPEPPEPRPDSKPVASPKRDKDDTTTATAKAVPAEKGVPYTALIEPKGELLERVRAILADPKRKGGPALILTIEGVILPDTPPLEARVFVVKTDAPIPTSIDDPGYVGQFSLGAAEDAGKPRNHILNLVPLVRRLAGVKWFDPKSLRVVVVGVGDEPGARPVEFTSATLEISK